VHHHGGHQAGADVNGILYPEHGHVENQISHGAPADPGDDGKPHEPHHVHALARSEERSGDREDHSREDIEEVHQPEQVCRLDNGGVHGTVAARVHRLPRRVLAQ
jgi:hypothetical protein